MPLTLDEPVGLVLCVIEDSVMAADIGKFALVHRQNTRIHIGLHTEKLSNKASMSELAAMFYSATREATYRIFRLV